MKTPTQPRPVGPVASGVVTAVFAVLVWGAAFVLFWQTLAALDQQQQALVAARCAAVLVWAREFKQIADEAEVLIEAVHQTFQTALAQAATGGSQATAPAQPSIRSPRNHATSPPAEPRGNPSGEAGSLVDARQRFETESRDFAAWLKEQRRKTAEPDDEVSVVLTPLVAQASPPRAPHRILEDIESAFEDYVHWARVVLDHAADPEVVERNTKQVDREYESIQALAQAARAQIEVTQRLLDTVAASRDRFRAVRVSLVVTMGLLGGLGFWSIRCALKRESQLRDLKHSMELQRKDLELEHQQQLNHFGQMAAALAHEIRNPLTAMSARVYTLQKTLPEGSAEYRDTQIIREEVQRLDRTVQNFLRLARPADPQPAPVPVGSLLSAVRDLLATPYQNQGIELRIEADDNLRVHADEAQLKQVLLNLIRNAAEAMPAGGTITLRARRELTSLRQRQTEAVILEVADTGPGIPPEVQEHLFTPFFSTKENGTGLGLAIAAKIINKHGGDLRYETHPPRGTTFRIVLPADDRTA